MEETGNSGPANPSSYYWKQIALATPGEHKTVQARILEYAEAAFPGQFRHIHTDIYGNRREPSGGQVYIVIKCE